MKPSSSSKPISSPGRALVEKFPPPLMRFLRSNVGSKSTRGKSKAKAKAKGKSKASPLFFRKKKPTAGEQEPSSPKVTCIGQVRVRRSKNTAARSRRRSKQEEKKKNRCWFGQKCHCPKGFRFMWRKWVQFFCCRPAKVRTGSSRAGSNPVEEDESRTQEEEEEIDEERESGKEVGLGVSSAAALVSTPPKNALLLTRCRSAPYRSSSLACRFWGEEAEEEEERENTAQKFTEERKREIGVVSVSVASGRESGGRDSASETMGIGSEIGSGNQRENEEEEEEEGKAGGPPAALMRSRSEPVRRGSERLDPLTMEFWRERRLSHTETTQTQTQSSCTPHADADADADAVD